MYIADVQDPRTARTHELIDRYTRPYFRPRPRVYMHGHGDRREAVGYVAIEGTVLTARTPTRPIIERMTQGNPQLRREALALAGCRMPAELGWTPWGAAKDAVSAVADTVSDAANTIVKTADKVAEKVTGKKLVSAAINVGKKVVQVAKDIAYSPYFQAALVALPVPGTAAVAAGIRAVQTLEALAKAAAKGRFDAKAALGLAKAGLKLKNAQTPQEKAQAEDLVRKAQAEAKRLGINPEQAKKALNVAKSAAESVVKSKAMVEKLVKAPDAVQQLMRKAAQAADPAKKEALENLAKAVQERKAGKGKKRGPFQRDLPAPKPQQITVTAEEKQKLAQYVRNLTNKMNAAKRRANKLEQSNEEIRRRANKLEQSNEEIRRRAERCQAETQRLKKLQRQTQQNWMEARQKAAQLQQAQQKADPEDARKLTPRLTQILRYVVEMGKQNDPEMMRKLKTGFQHYQQQAGIPVTGKYDGATRGAMIHFGADNPPPPFTGGETVPYSGPRTDTQIVRPPKLVQEARAKGKKLYMVQAPSMKVYPVAV